MKYDIYEVTITILDVLEHRCSSIIVTMHSFLTLLLPTLILMTIHGTNRSVELVWMFHGIHRAFYSLDLPSFLGVWVTVILEGTMVSRVYWLWLGTICLRLSLRFPNFAFLCNETILYNLIYVFLFTVAPFVIKVHMAHLLGDVSRMCTLLMVWLKTMSHETLVHHWRTHTWAMRCSRSLLIDSLSSHLLLR